MKGQKKNVVIQKKISRCAALGLVLLLGLLLWIPGPAGALVQVSVGHEVSAQAQVIGGDFVRARKKAVAIAMRAAVRQALRDLLGEQGFAEGGQLVSELLSHPERYVKRYRYLDSYDDPNEMTSSVTLEVTIFSDAITRSLGNMGVLTTPQGAQKVVLLIRERSVTNEPGDTFWDSVPISETAIVQSLTEAGIEVVSRDDIQRMIPEEVVKRALQGHLADAVNIGLKTGADIVLLGNAISNLMGADPFADLKTIQANITLKAVSAYQSSIVAAKSDFATAQSRDPLSGELQAFKSASKRLMEFLLPTLRRHWDSGAVAQRPVSTPTPPLPMNDL